MGFGSNPLSKSSIYDGSILQAESVQSGQIFLLGDTARTTDPISGNGVNVAIHDGVLIGDFARNRMSARDEAKARQVLVSNLREDTRWSLEGSLYFQSLIRWLRDNPMKAKRIFQSAIPENSEISKSLFSALVNLTPRKVLGLLSTAVKDVFQAPIAPRYGRPFRTRQIAIHPTTQFEIKSCSDLLNPS
jgi:2-polyprenyl-6-methoxyphenol hydroxylase-like FAD-dependent oxidoreductase